MDLLTRYASDSDEERDSHTPTSAPLPHPTRSPSPPPPPSSLPSSSLVLFDPSPPVSLSSSSTHLIASTTRTVYHNPTAAVLYAPTVGPHDPSASHPPDCTPNHVLGYVEPTVVSDGFFDTAYHSFISKGHTVDPGHTAAHDTRVVYDSRRAERQAATSSSSSSSPSSPPNKRRLLSDPSDVDGFLGPWRSREPPPVPVAPTEEQLRLREENAARKVKQVRDDSGNVVTAETSTLHIAEAKDYQGRSFVDAPPEVRRVDWTAASAGQCYAPKALLHTWTGHRKGVSAIRFFPFTSHLLLSASMDHTVKIWRASGDYRCLRTYTGHAEAVRDISFSHDGLHFLSVSYDRHVKLWDTETGQCVLRHSTGKAIPFCGRMHPLPVHGSDCLIGQSNKLVVQLDTRSGVVATEYNEHLQTVHSLTFIDDARRFVSTSDDKKVLIWEYGLPVVVKHITDPSLHSIPAVTLHPSGRHFLGQSMDNQILIFTAGGKYKLKRDKRLVGHQVAGYACEVGVSPDGRWVSSGDGEGRLWVWDWKTGRVVKKIKCHDQVLIGCEWMENETSKVATCSWDGTIKLWD